MPSSAVHRISRRAFAAAAAFVSASAAIRQVTRGQESPMASPQATPASGGPALMLRMESVGGTNPPELQLNSVPDFSLYDDGSLYRIGPSIAIFPPPALPNVTRMRVSVDAVSAIMEHALEAGLDEPREIPNPTMNDMPSIRFLFFDGENFVETTAWGVLGMFADDQPPEWDEETVATFEALRELASFLTSLPTNLPEHDLLEQEMPVDPDRLQVISFEASGDTVLPSGIPDLEQPPLTWPLSRPLEEISTPFEPAESAGIPMAGCVSLSGADARAVVETSQEGNLLSPWTDSGVTYGVLLKPLLPDQAGCAPFTGE